MDNRLFLFRRGRGFLNIVFGGCFLCSGHTPSSVTPHVPRFRVLVKNGRGTRQPGPREASAKMPNALQTVDPTHGFHSRWITPECRTRLRRSAGTRAS
jgi:hypothetical protein